MSSLRIRGTRAASARRRFDDDVEILRLGLTAASQDRGLRVLSLIGLSPGSGTTTLSVRLALSMARESRRTLLVGANVVNPDLAELLQTSAEPGVFDLLKGTATASEAVRGTSDPCLSVLPLGHCETWQGVSVERWRSLLKDLAADQFVMIDAGSIDSPSALATATASDGVALVVKCGSADRHQIETTKRRMSSSGVQLLGVVLNQRRYVVPEAIYQRL